MFSLYISGDQIYGRVMVDPVQNLGDSFFCSIEKVFLCTGADGYVPKYNPTKFEFGCLADSPSLLYRFKILVSFSAVILLCKVTFHCEPWNKFLSFSVFFSWSHTLIGQGSAWDSGTCVWWCGFQCCARSGWPSGIVSCQTAWLWWLQAGLHSHVPGIQNNTIPQRLWLIFIFNLQPHSTWINFKWTPYMRY